jgi:hypothetical protein
MWQLEAMILEINTPFSCRRNNSVFSLTLTPVRDDRMLLCERAGVTAMILFETARGMVDGLDDGGV